MPTVKLTDAALQKYSAPPNARKEWFDATLPGFGIRVAGPTKRSPQGRKSWVLFYRFGGEQRRLTIEPGYPALSLADARKRAGDALAMLATGVDPAAAKAETKATAARKPDTVSNVVDQFMLRHMEGKNRAPRYVAETRRNFDLHVIPYWGDRPIGSITRREVVEMLDRVADGGSKIKDTDGTSKVVRGGKIAANRVLAAVRAMFNWALRRGMIDTTPAALVERPGEETRRERTLSADEIRVIWPQAVAMAYPMGSFFRMVLLTGQRREEVGTMAWADIDLEAKTWTIPAERTKAGRAHVVPLSPAAIDLLKSVPKKTTTNAARKTVPSPHVFTFTGDHAISGYSAAKTRLDTAVNAARKEAGLEPLVPWTVHDMRRTVATELGRMKTPRLVISKVLNHADQSVTGIYDKHDYLEEKQKALEAWGEYLMGVVKPAAVKARRRA